VLLVGCPPEKPAEAPAQAAPAPGSEGEPCAVGDRVVRACGAGLACTAMPVAPADPKEKQVLSLEGGSCGGVAQIPCGDGLACLMNEDEPLVGNAMGLCKTQSVCMPAAPGATGGAD